MMGKFEIYRDNGGKFRWRLMSGDDRIVACTEEEYDSRSDAVAASRAAQRAASEASITDADAIQVQQLGSPKREPTPV